MSNVRQIANLQKLYVMVMVFFQNSTRSGRLNNTLVCDGSIRNKIVLI